MVLFNFLLQNISIKLHIIEMLKPFFCSWVKPTQLVDLIFLTSTLITGPCYCNNLTMSALFRVILHFAWLPFIGAARGGAKGAMAPP